jgi:hypothetical protein
MKKPNATLHALSEGHKTLDLEHLRVLAAARARRPNPGSHATAAIVAHVEALGAGRPTVSPAKARSHRSSQQD